MGRGRSAGRPQLGEAPDGATMFHEAVRGPHRPVSVPCGPLQARDSPSQLLAGRQAAGVQGGGAGGPTLVFFTRLGAMVSGPRGGEGLACKRWEVCKGRAHESRAGWRKLGAAAAPPETGKRYGARSGAQGTLAGCAERAPLPRRALTCSGHGCAAGQPNQAHNRIGGALPSPQYPAASGVRHSGCCRLLCTLLPALPTCCCRRRVVGGAGEPW